MTCRCGSVSRWISASQPRSCSSTVTMVVTASSPDVRMCSNSFRLAVEGWLSAETWSVSRTSNLFIVGLLLAILPSEPFRLARQFVVRHGAHRSMPILSGRLQAKNLRAQLRNLLLQLLHPFFKCLRHGVRL